MTSIASMLIDGTTAGSDASVSPSPAPTVRSHTQTAATLMHMRTGTTTPVPSESSTETYGSGSLPSIFSCSPPALAIGTPSGDAPSTRRRKVLTSRPPNSFILYRSDKLRELIQQFPDLKQTEISKMCAENWKSESAQVKEHYRFRQQEAKAKFLAEQAREVQKLAARHADKVAIKRIQPTNTFIRYRTEMKKKLAKQFAAMNQKDVSRACGLMWRKEPEHVKMRYRQSYNQEKRDYERMCMTSLEDDEASAHSGSPVGRVPSAQAVAGAVRERVASSSPHSDSDAWALGCARVHSAPTSPPMHSAAATLRRNTDPNPASPHQVHLPSCASLLSMAPPPQPQFAAGPAPGQWLPAPFPQASSVRGSYPFANAGPKHYPAPSVAPYAREMDAGGMYLGSRSIGEDRLTRHSAGQQQQQQQQHVYADRHRVENGYARGIEGGAGYRDGWAQGTESLAYSSTVHGHHSSAQLDAYHHTY